MNQYNQIARWLVPCGGMLLVSCGAAAPESSASPRGAQEPSEETPASQGSVEPQSTEPGGSSTSASSAPSAAQSPDPATSATPVKEPPPPPCSDDMKFVAGGTFTTAMNRREVQVADLCVDTFETTAAQYKECVDAGKCSTNRLLCSEQSTWSKPDKQDHPMVCVDFSQAEAYCSFRGKRLPETGEWEWVARGGEQARKYPWGNEEPTDQLCWQGKKPLEGTCKVGSFPGGVSADGIYDLSGGVHEFTTTAEDATGKIRIARGGSWKEGDALMMWPGRIGGFETSYRCGFLGIRCVDVAQTTAAADLPAAADPVAADPAVAK